MKKLFGRLENHGDWTMEREGENEIGFYVATTTSGTDYYFEITKNFIAFSVPGVKRKVFKKDLSTNFEVEHSYTEYIASLSLTIFKFKITRVIDEEEN